MSWSADDWWKHRSWSVVAGESGLAHTRTIVDNKSSNVVVTHFDLFIDLGESPNNCIPALLRFCLLSVSTGYFIGRRWLVYK